MTVNYDFWAEEGIGIPPKQKATPEYRPSSEVIPHWREARPVWEMSDEEFFESQVAGRLLSRLEHETQRKATHFIRSAFTPEQIHQAAEEVKALRRSGDLPKNLAAFRRDPLPKTFREMRQRRQEARSGANPSSSTPVDDCPF